MIIPVSVGGPIVFCILEGFELGIYFSTVCCAASLLCIIVANAIEVEPGQRCKPCISIKNTVQTKTLCFESALVQIAQCSSEGLSIQKLTATRRNDNNGQHKK